jgi:LysR family transcriptional regulator, carnitine catabolism transcriptional activator
MEVSTRQLRAFRLAAQHHSFARAAESLYITPSGLSVLIKELENRVGFRLFDRTTRHVELTPDGRQLLAVIQRSLEELDVAIANIGRGAKRHRESISLGTTPLVAANILPPAMREFRKLRPDVQIQLFDADLPTLIQMVEAGKLDMSLGIFKAMPDVRREPFFRFSLMVARAAKDDIPPRKSTPWVALEGETCKFMRAPSVQRSAFLAILQAYLRRVTSLFRRATSRGTGRAIHVDDRFALE